MKFAAYEFNDYLAMLEDELAMLALCGDEIALNIAIINALQEQEPEEDGAVPQPV